MTEINICPACNITITGPGYPKLHTCTKSNLFNRIEQLQTENETYKKAINRAITIIPLAKSSYVISELEQVLKGE